MKQVALLSMVLALTLSACGGGSTSTPSAFPVPNTTPSSTLPPITTPKSLNEQQVEKLLGTLRFDFSTSPNTVSFFYNLIKVVPYPDLPDEYLAIGFDDRDPEKAIVVGGYDSKSDDFYLLDAGQEADVLYTFRIGINGRIAGCAYVIQHSGESSACSPITGQQFP